MNASTRLPPRLLVALAAASLALVTPGSGCGPKSSDSRVDAGPTCTTGTSQCNGLTWQNCVASHWVDKAPCGAFCDPSLGCTQCPPNGTFCDGSNVVNCDNQGNPGSVRTTCAGMCISGDCTDPCGHAAAELSYAGCNYFPTVTTNSNLIERDYLGRPAQATFAVAVANTSNDVASIEVTRDGMSIATKDVPVGDVVTIPLPWIRGLKDPFEVTIDPNIFVAVNKFYSTQVKGGAYQLTSNQPVTVYQFNPIEFKLADPNCVDPSSRTKPCYTYTNDASLLLPSTTLTQHYIAIARESFILKRTDELFYGKDPFYTAAPGFIAIVGTDDATTNVTVKFTAATLAGRSGAVADFENGQKGTGAFMAYPVGATGTFQIQKGEVLQLLSDSPATCNQMGSDMQDDGQGGTLTFGYCDVITTDLTGTEINADHKIAVFGGHDCTFVPFNKWACDHLEQQMLPLESWGREYVGAHTKRSPATIPDVWRVVSGTDDNTITFDPPTIHDPISLSKGQYAEFVSKNDFLASGSGAFQLVQYMVGENYVNSATCFDANKQPIQCPGDPAMCLSVPTAQFRTNYVFLTPDTYTENYVNIVAQVGAQVTLDGTSLDPATFKGVDGAGKWAAVRIPVEAGSHSVSASTQFGISVYGLASFTSYMYPGGLDVKHINIQ